jgi:hypothetical protein
MEELNKLKSIDLASCDDEEIVELFDIIEAKCDELSNKDLKDFFYILVEILSKRRGIAGKRAYEILSSLYPRMKEDIVSLLWSDVPYIRNSALSIIAYHRDRDVVLGLLKNKDKDIRKFGLDIAFEMGDAEILEKGFDDDDPNVVVSAAEYLARLGYEGALDKMVNKLLSIPSENLYELLFIFESLIRLAYPSTPELIERKFHDLSDPIIKDVYVRACGVSNNKKYINYLLSVLDDESVRKNALDSIFSIIRNVHISDQEKENIKKEIESRFTKMSPDELEIAGKIIQTIY